MDATDVTDGLHSLRYKAVEIEETLKNDEATRLAEWAREETQVKDYIKALGDSRNIMRKEHSRLQAEQAANIAAAEKKAAALAREEAAPGIPLGFNPIRAVKGKDGEAVQETELHSELQRLKSQMNAIDASIAAARSQLENLKKEDERTVWETNIVILKDTRRMHAEEAGMIELELEGRERVRKNEEERARAEDSGAIAAAQMAQQITSVEARLDALKQRLYFPPIKGFSFALGSNGIYFGGKDFKLSELSGSFGLSAEVVPSTVKGEEGQNVARLSMRAGSSAAMPAKSGEGSAKLGKASFLRRSAKSIVQSARSKQPTQDATPEGKAERPASAPQSRQDVKSADEEHQKHDTHLESSQAAAESPAVDSISSKQASGRSGSFSTVSRQNLQGAEQHNSGARSGSLSKDPSAPVGDRRRSISANGDIQTSAAHWKGNDDYQNFMKAKTSQGKKLAFGFLSRVGSKDKYAKRLDKLKQGVLQGNSDLNGPLQPGGGPSEQRRPNLAARLLPKRALNMDLSFGKHHLRSSSQRQRSLQREMQPPPTVMEEEPHSLPEYTAPPRRPIIGSNPHSCSSRARPLPGGQGANSGNLLFQNPFDKDPEQSPGHAAPSYNVNEASSAAVAHGDPHAGSSQASAAAAQKQAAPYRNPFEVPEMLDASQGPAAEAVTAYPPQSPFPGQLNPFEEPPVPAQLNPFEGPPIPAQQNPFEDPSLPSQPNPFEDPPGQGLGKDLEGDEELQPELPEENGADEDDTDGESVQEAAPDAGMGHLIAGGFGSADSIGVSSSPMPPPKKPPPDSRTTASARTGTSQGSGAMDSASTSTSGRAGLWVVLRLSSVGLVGERGSKVPNASIGELSLEIEVALALDFEYASTSGWRPAGKPRFEVRNLQRTLKNSSVPVPKTLLRMILNATLPRLLQRTLLVALPPELGQYLLACKQGVHIAGEAGIVGPALSCFDVDLSAASRPGATPKNATEAKRMAQQHATAQEARSMLGITLEQADLLDALFAGPEALVDPPRPCSISELQTMYLRCAHLPAAWESLCAVWDVGLRTMGKFRGVLAPGFITLMDSVALLQRKPVRARLALTRVDVAVGVDAALLAIRCYCERAAKELHAAGGRILPKDGRAPPSLQQQLETLQAWHAFLATRLQAFKSKFRAASVALVAAADCNSVSVGLDAGHYEGPLRIRLPVKLSPGASAEGAWSFEVPLPNPASQKLLSRLIGGLKAALNSPPALVRLSTKAPLPHQRHKPSEAEGRRLKVSHVVGLASAGTESSQSSPRSQEVLNADSSNGNAQQNAEGNAQSSREEHPLLAQPPTEWFGPLAEELLALQPQKLGKVTVSGMRIRVRLDEGRITELLKGLDGHATTTAGLLNCIGDLATISFAPHMSEEEGQDEYLLALESSDMANLCADVAALGFLGGAGVTPSRLLRVGHALTRVALMTLSGDVGRLQTVDKYFNAIYEHVVREALDVSLCLDASAGMDKESKEMVVHVRSMSEDAWPLTLTNDVDLASLAPSS